MSESNGLPVLFDLSGPDEGYEKVLLPGSGEVRVNVYEMNNRIVALQEEKQGQPAHAFHAGVVELMKATGFPEVSHYTADRFALAVIRRTAELAKKAEGPAGASDSSAPSPASTG